MRGKGWETRNAIVKYTSAQLVALPSDQMVAVIDKGVKQGFRRIDDANAKLRKAKAEREAYIGEDPQEAQRLTDEVEKCRLAVRARINDIEEYLNEQKEMFKSKGLDGDRAYKEAIIPTGKFTDRGVEMFLIVKRGESLEESESDDETAPSVRASRGYSANIGMQREMSRGKYHDGHILIEQAAASIDPSERVSFGNACM